MMGENFAFTEAQAQAVVVGMNFVDASVFYNGSTGAIRGTRESADEFARVAMAAGKFSRDAQVAGILPDDGRIRQMIFAADFPRAGKVQVAIDSEFAKDAAEIVEDITEGGKVSGCAFGEGHAAGASARAGADGVGFEDGDARLRRNVAQPGGRGEPGEARADDGDVHLLRNGTRSWTKINLPRRNAPARAAGSRFRRLFDRFASLDNFGHLEIRCALE